MTEQDRQRARFEAWVAEQHPAAPLDRSMTHVALCGELPAGKQLYTAQALAAMDAQRTGSANAHVFATQACAQVAPAGDA